MASSAGLRWLERGLLALGLLLLAYWTADFLDARRYQADESRKLDAALRARAPQPDERGEDDVELFGWRAARRPGAALARGSVLGRVEIPRLGLKAIVAEGVDSKTLARAVGHFPATALPGRSGNCALAGHRDTFLRGLGRLRVNDVVQVVTRERTYRYQVEWRVVVDPHRVDVLDDTAGRSLTIVTCYPFRYVGHAPKRFVVRARLVETLAAR